MKQASPRFNFFSLHLVLTPKKVKEHWSIGNEIALCPWLIWSDSNATHLLLFISTTCALTHHSCASILYLCQLFRVAHASDLPLLSKSTVQIQMQKKICIQAGLCLQINCSNPNAKKICIHLDLCLRIICSNPNAKKRYASTRTCVFGSTVQIQMQNKDMHPLGLVSADQMFKSKCKTKICI